MSAGRNTLAPPSALHTARALSTASSTGLQVPSTSDTSSTALPPPVRAPDAVPTASSTASSTVPVLEPVDEPVYVTLVMPQMYINVIKKRAGVISKRQGGAPFVGLMDVTIAAGMAIYLRLGANRPDPPSYNAFVVASLRGTSKKCAHAEDGGFFGNYLLPLPLGGYSAAEFSEYSSHDIASIAARIKKSTELLNMSPAKIVMKLAAAKLCACCRGKGLDFDQDGLVTISFARKLIGKKWKGNTPNIAEYTGEAGLDWVVVQRIVMAGMPTPYSTINVDAAHNTASTDTHITLCVPSSEALPAQKMFDDMLAALEPTARREGTIANTRDETPFGNSGAWYTRPAETKEHTWMKRAVRGSWRPVPHT